MSKKIMKIIGIIFAILLLLLIIVPLIIPIPVLENVVPPKQLADANSKFITVNGLEIHYKKFSQGEPVIILKHGFGASEFSWREVEVAFSKLGTVIAYNRPASGLTQRPLPGDWWAGNPYSNTYQDKLLVGLIDTLLVNKAILIGNSAGGTVAVQTAINYPDRVRGLVLVDAAILTSGGIPTWLGWLFQLPEMNRLGPLLVRNIQSWGLNLLKTAWNDPSKISQEVLDGYQKPLHAINWDIGFWEMTRPSQPINLKDNLFKLHFPTLILTRDDDRIVPTADSIELAKLIPNAKLVIFSNCGHVPQEECPSDFLSKVIPFLEQFKD